jgi:putative endonuclease
MNNFIIYAIYNKKCNKTYIGQTKDINERLKLHNEKRLKGYTSRFAGSWEIIYIEEAENRQDALIREKQLKSYQGRQFIKQFIPA